MTITRPRAQGGDYRPHYRKADADAFIEAIEDVLREFYAATGVIDNGRCAVCRIGYRAWKLPKCDTPAGPCSNDECISRRCDEILRRPIGVQP